jgi:hypothetical protein
LCLLLRLLVIAAGLSAQTATEIKPRVGSAAPTFNQHVAPILFANCVSCHRPGDVAPMSLVSY